MKVGDFTDMMRRAEHNVDQLRRELSVIKYENPDKRNITLSKIDVQTIADGIQELIDFIKYLDVGR